MGRPKSKIDWNKVDNYLKAHCTGTEVAAVLGVCPDTLYRACESKFKVTFAVYSQQKKENGNAILRAKQFQSAIEGDKTMQIWLGKQHLGQREKQSTEIEMINPFSDLMKKVAERKKPNE